MLRPRTGTSTNDAFAAKRAKFQLEADAIRADRALIVPDRNGLSKERVGAYNDKVADFENRAKAAGLSSFYLSFVDDCGFVMSSSKFYYQAWAGAVTVLEVPFEEKDAAKAAGAKWNTDHKTWYVPADVDIDPFQKWI